MSRYEIYRRGFFFASIASLVMATTTAIALIMAWSAFTSKPEPRYFATREDGGIIPLVAVSQPFLTDGQVTNFAVEAVTAAMTMDFANWRQDLARSSRYFQRPDGWENYLTALDEAGILEFIQTRRLVSTAVANGATIVQSGLDLRNRFAWTVQIPLQVTYESASERSTENLLAEVVISRLPTWESSDAVGITRITMRPGR